MDPAVWSVDTFKRTSQRRESLNIDGFTVINFTSTNRRHILSWLDTNTTGQFFIGKNVVTFELARDAIMFNLMYSE